MFLEFNKNNNFKMRRNLLILTLLMNLKINFTITEKEPMITKKLKTK